MEHSRFQLTIVAVVCNKQVSMQQFVHKSGAMLCNKQAAVQKQTIRNSCKIVQIILLFAGTTCTDENE